MRLLETAQVTLVLRHPRAQVGLHVIAPVPSHGQAVARVLLRCFPDFFYRCGHFFLLFRRFPQEVPILHSFCTSDCQFVLAEVHYLKQSAHIRSVKCPQRPAKALRQSQWFPAVLEGELLEGSPERVRRVWLPGRCGLLR